MFRLTVAVILRCAQDDNGFSGILFSSACPTGPALELPDLIRSRSTIRNHAVRQAAPHLSCSIQHSASIPDGPSSCTKRLIWLNSGVPATWHHSNKAASVVVSVAPAESIRPNAVR